MPSLRKNYINDKKQHTANAITITSGKKIIKKTKKYKTEKACNGSCVVS